MAVARKKAIVDSSKLIDLTNEESDSRETQPKLEKATSLKGKQPSTTTPSSTTQKRRKQRSLKKPPSIDQSSEFDFSYLCTNLKKLRKEARVTANEVEQCRKWIKLHKRFARLQMESRQCIRSLNNLGEQFQLEHSAEYNELDRLDTQLLGRLSTVNQQIKSLEDECPSVRLLDDFRHAP